MGTNFPTTSTVSVGWMDNMHAKQGNVALADGSVQQFSRSRLQEALRNSGDAGGNSNGNFQTAQNPGPLNYNRIQFP
jgi:prepilin-type processing-associated H-X9-DG protein